MTLEIKRVSRINGILEKNGLLWNVDLAAVEETLVAGEPERRGKGTLTDVNEESGCGEKGGSVLEDMKLAENTSSEAWFTVLKGQRVKCWKPIQSKRSVTARQSTGRMGGQALPGCARVVFYKEREHFILIVSDELSDSVLTYKY